MDLKKIKGLADLLRSLTATMPTDVERFTSFLAYDSFAYEKHSVKERDDIYVWYDSQYVGQFSTLQEQVIAPQLKEAGHPASAKFIAAVILTYVVMRRRLDAVDDLQGLLKSFTAADVSQFFIMPCPSFVDIYPRKDAKRETEIIGPFQIGPFRHGPFAGKVLDQVKYRLTRAGLARMIPDIEKRTARFSISREPRSIKVLDFDALGIAGRSEVEVTLSNNYFDDLSFACFDEFWSEHLESQIHHVAAGADILDRSTLESIQGGTWLSIFLGFTCQDRGGTASFLWEESHLVGKVTLKLLHYAEHSEKHNRLISTEIRQPLGEGPYRLVQSVQNLARAMTYSRELALRDYADEEFLLLIEGMESLVGEKGNLQNSVARRIGAILALAENAPFDRMNKEIKDLYNERSKFVHENVRIDRESLPRTEQKCRIVYFAAFRSQAATLNAHPDNWKNRWLALLDYLASSFLAGVPLDHNAVTQSGANPVDSAAVLD